MSPFLNGDPVGPGELDREAPPRAGPSRRSAQTALELLGDAGSAGFWHERYLYSRAASVYGGTRQIQRSIIADRILALPQD